MTSSLAREIHERRQRFNWKLAQQAKIASAKRQMKQTQAAAEAPPPPPAPVCPDALTKQLMRLPREVFARPQWKIIARQICAKYNVDFDEVFSDRRHKHLVLIRHEIFYRLKVDLQMSYPQIAEKFNKDHTTVLHGVRKHAARLSLEMP